ncbi:ribosome maturation factor RimM [Brevibacterium sp. 5221]|uniref:Ribosome maturation factor RimM n=1 Tax=Brevibacterium rongguiense TaxID=2695267 RepID=A0A6N9H971_9MICO|nr:MULTISPECIES: ribosome maturation factor RimM [Brevibacterium]MYM20084.1 ribosome maturation factor RimM [Brevibacterium rongguiense]WAL41288.1 ribosome maturation factor RimM [Brevibacterium sp. BRM-1]
MSHVVARLGKPHGIRGEVTVEVRTDDPDERFVPGAVFSTEPDIGELTLARARWHRDRLLLTFDEIPDRNRAEEVRNTLIGVDAEADEAEDAWLIEDLVGAQAIRAGEVVGEIADVTTGAAQDLLHLRLPDGREVLVPFVEALVPVVDLEARRVEIDPPDGLLEG